jgi:hypothetical protein
MQACELLIRNVELGTKLIRPLLEDLQDAPLERTLSDRGNHAHWMLGHMLFSEAQMCRSFAMGQDNPYTEWSKLFKGGTESDTDAAEYPPYPELLGLFLSERENTIAILQGLTDDDLGTQPAIILPGYEDFFPNKAAVFILNANHPFMHYGQLADIRRRLGRDILMA